MKDPTEYTGIESFVKEKFDNSDISWVPLLKALCLDDKVTEGAEELEQQKKEKKLREVAAKVGSLQERLDKVVSQA